MDNIFKLIKLKKFNEVNKIINSNIDLNIYDEQNNYLIHYIILNNEIELLKKILKKGIQIDILDMDGRTLLYIPIKYNYIESLELLLNFNKNIIGISILDLKDNFGFTALHYCILFNNFECLKLLLKANADPLITDNNGDNVVHLSLKEKKNKITIYLLDHVKLDFLTSKNETLLQLSLTNEEIFKILLKKDIKINNQESDYGLSILHQVILLNNIEFIKEIINKGANINLQDYNGNTPLMYAINENLINIIKIFINYDINYDLINSKGDTHLHIILKNLDFYINHIDILKLFIKNTNLNIQNNKGNTCLFLIIKNKLLNKFKDILENKELNLFINNNNNINSYNIIIKDELYIIINSFYNNIKNNHNKLLLKWEIDCLNTNENICKDKIKNTIINEKRSIPKLDTHKLVLDHGIFLDRCFYTGSSIDILMGIIFLYNKFKNNGLNIILDYPLTKNTELENYFNSLGINFNYKLDFCNFEINWSFQKLIFPTYFDHEFNIKIKENKYIIIPLGIETINGSHANILFFDINNKIIERFEPNGANEPRNFNYNYKLLDNLLIKKFQNFKYKSPEEYLPVIGLGLLENINEINCNRIGDPNGFCGVWCIWWIYHKMKNIKIKSKELAEKLIKEIKF